MGGFGEIMNKNDIRKQARWELCFERFEEAVKKEKERLSKKRSLFPWRIKLINVNRKT